MSKNLIDYYSDPNDGAPEALTELRLGAEPALVLLFTPEVDETLLHYIDDEAVRAYVKCPGERCPVCYTGAKPAHFDLLPVFDVESGIVKVLRISDNRKPAGLGAKLIPHLKNEDIADRLILMSRRGMADYRIESRPLGPDANRGEVEIRAFSERVGSGLQLDTAFQAMTCEELAAVPKVAARLGAMGGWLPPDSDATGSSSAPDPT